MQLKVSENIKRYRKSMDLTQEELAEALGVTLHSATGLLTTLRKAGIVKREYEGKTPVYSLGSEA